MARPAKNLSTTVAVANSSVRHMAAKRNQCREQEPTKLTGGRSTLPCPHISGGPSKQRHVPRNSATLNTQTWTTADLDPRTPTSWTCRPDRAEIQAPQSRNQRKHSRCVHARRRRTTVTCRRNDGQTNPTELKVQTFDNTLAMGPGRHQKTTHDEHVQKLQQSNAHVLLVGGFLNAKKKLSEATCAAGSA